MNRKKNGIPTAKKHNNESSHNGASGMLTTPICSLHDVSIKSNVPRVNNPMNRPIRVEPAMISNNTPMNFTKIFSNTSSTSPKASKKLVELLKKLPKRKKYQLMPLKKNL
mgnify:CR=1 FL=1